MVDAARPSMGYPPDKKAAVPKANAPSTTTTTTSTSSTSSTSHHTNSTTANFLAPTNTTILRSKTPERPTTVATTDRHKTPTRSGIFPCLCYYFYHLCIITRKKHALFYNYIFKINDIYFESDKLNLFLQELL